MLKTGTTSSVTTTAFERESDVALQKSFSKISGLYFSFENSKLSALTDSADVLQISKQSSERFTRYQ
jgi:hypothetical protein